MKTEQPKPGYISTSIVRHSAFNVIPTLLVSLFCTRVLQAAELQANWGSGRLGLNWQVPNGKLQEASALNGPWQTMTTAAPPCRVVTSAPRRYYRLALPPPGKKWLTVAAVTLNAKTNVAANLQTFFSYMETAASNNVDLVVFPEIALQQCPVWGPASHTPTPEEMAYLRETAETIPGASTSNVVAKARELNLFVAFGMTEQDETNRLHNANVLLGPDGSWASIGSDTWWRRAGG